MNYAVIAYRRQTGETMYYVESVTQGKRMLPAADSLATQFGKKSEARQAMAEAQNLYPGLVNWTVAYH